jgi:sulfoxide reductase heme-binding subunit YedZ
MIDWVLHCPTWPLIRMLGLASYAMLFLGVALGIGYGFPGLGDSSKRAVYRLHAVATWLAFLTGLLHGMLLYVDTYQPFEWREVFVPFRAANEPFGNGIGTIALYGIILLLLTTDLRHRLGRKLWLGLHLMAYPVFGLALLHGLLTGTDLRLPAGKLLYESIGGIVVGLALLRFAASRFAGRAKRNKAHNA